jgi:hypothetical protein
MRLKRVDKWGLLTASILFVTLLGFNWLTRRYCLYHHEWMKEGKALPSHYAGETAWYECRREDYCANAGVTDNKESVFSSIPARYCPLCRGNLHYIVVDLLSN